jgi:hypothetical protein
MLLQLSEYLGFRHIVRNVYAFQFNPKRIEDLVGNLRNCFNEFKNEIGIFIKFLKEI